MISHNFFVLKNGVCCKKGKYSCYCYVNEKGKIQFITNKEKEIIKHKKLFFIRGIEFLFSSIYFLIQQILKIKKNKNILNNKKNIKNTEKTQKNIKKTIFNVFFCLIFILLLFLLIYYLPKKFVNIFNLLNNYLIIKRIFLTMIRLGIVYSIFCLSRLCPKINQIYKFNTASNLVANNYEEASLKKDFYRNTNFLSYIVFSFIFSVFVLSLLGQTLNTFLGFFINLFLVIISMGLPYEICKYLDEHKNKFTDFISRLNSWFLIVSPTYSEIIVCQTTLNEVILLNENKLRKTQNDAILSPDYVGFSFAYSEVKEKLKKAGIYEISDVDWIFATVLNKSRNEIKLLYTIKKEDYKKIMKVTSLRAKGQPLSKIFGFADFYGERFIVNENVLSPRPETEILCEKAINILKGLKNPTVLDMCTGSGVIGITVALNVESKVTLADISVPALNVAKENAKNTLADVKIIQSDLFENIKGKFDVIISNPPYIKSEDIKSLSKEVKDYDPILALDGGEDGLDFYRKIIQDCPKHLAVNGYLMLEIGFGEANSIKKLLQKDFEDIIIVKDYSKIARIIIARKKDSYVRKDKKD